MYTGEKSDFAQILSHCAKSNLFPLGMRDDLDCLGDSCAIPNKENAISIAVHVL